MHKRPWSCLVSALPAVLPVMLALVVSGMLILPLPGHAAEFIARVVKVKDGDSVVLRSGRTLYEARLAGIDAPEYDQTWGGPARKALHKLVYRQTVSVRVEDIDSYGRLVVHLRREQTSINRTMVAQGHAWAYRRYLRDRTLLDVESAARADRKGIWQASKVLPPWSYRRGQREPQALAATSPDLFDQGSALLHSLEGDFSCGSKKYCSQMASCSEANFYLQHCGLSGIDGDNDGKPCERLCSQRSTGRSR